jgi:hypothetical protein
MPIVKTSDGLFKKMDAKLALQAFKDKYKKIPKGIQKIYENMMLTDDYKIIAKEHSRFFGYIKKSKNSKTKWEELEKM